MLEPYLALLHQFRANPSTWTEAAYTPDRDADNNWRDPGYRNRYGVLICLQYDLRAEDHSLLRYLFEQEMLSRRGDPYSSESSALKLGVHLLARLRHPEDLPRVVDAKQLNFDIFCALPAEYLLIFGPEVWEGYRGRQSRKEQKALDRSFRDVVKRSTPVALRNWWRHQETLYPISITEEKAATRASQAYELGDLEAARYWAGEWEAREGETLAAASRLCWFWEQLGCPDAALRCLEVQRDGRQSTAFDRASFDCHAARLLTQAGRCAEAWDVLQRIGRPLLGRCEWKGYGLALSIVEELLEFALRTECPTPLRREAFELADRLMRKDVDASHVVLEKAVAAAALLEDAEKVAGYTCRCDAEWERIQRSLGRR